MAACLFIFHFGFPCVVDGFVFCLMMGIDSGGNDYNKYD